MDINPKSKGGSIVLLIFLLICSGLGISAFVKDITNRKECKVESYNDFPPGAAGLPPMPAAVAGRKTVSEESGHPSWPQEVSQDVKSSEAANSRIAI